MALLTGRNVVVTRPRTQAENLCQLIEAHGGKAFLLPAIEIVAIENNAALLNCQLNQLDIVIFVSTHAVEIALPVLLKQNLPAQLEIAAVGQKTANALKKFGLTVICPETSFDSEALLALPKLQAVQGKKIVIFRGEGGRELLAQTLHQRGATVEYINVYQRIQPPIPANISTLQMDIITATSVEILRNTFNLLSAHPKLRQTPFAVLSQRIHNEAKKFGIQAPITVAPTASDQGLMEAILKNPALIK